MNPLWWKKPQLWNLMPWACAVFAGWVILAIIFDRVLYADGSYYFITVLRFQHFGAGQWSRHFADQIFEFPLVLAIKSGVTNPAWLRLAFGLGCFLPWPVALLGCYWISPKHFWLVVVACAAGYLNAAFMAVGEHILAHALFWPALFVILFARPLKPLAGVILLASATGMLFSYESQLFFGLLLAGLSFWRMAEEMREWPIAAHKGKIWSWLVLLIAGGLFLVASGIGLQAVLKPEIPSNYVSLRGNIEGMIYHKGWTLTWSILWGCLMLGVWLSEKMWRIIKQKTIVVVLLGGLFIWAAWPLLAPGHLDPARQYDNRILDLLVPLMLLPAALIARYRPDGIEPRFDRLKQMAAIWLIVQSLWQIGATVQWHKDIGKLQAILSNRNGLILLHTTSLTQTSIESKRAEFDWTWPCLSIALAPAQDIHSLVCPEVYADPRFKKTVWRPFDPTEPKSLPDLEHYGINFTNYVAALHNQYAK